MKAWLSAHNVDFTIIDISTGMLPLKQFLKYRDTREEFASIKEAGRVGLPCIVINKGEPGYTPTARYGDGVTPREAVDAANKAMGVTRAQEEAMVAGSMFGWHVPGADPKNYNENGEPIRPQRKDRGEAR